MSRILISGLTNIETTLKIEGFPQQYFPVTFPFHGIQSTVSGVGINLVKALGALGHDVHLLSIVGADPLAELVRQDLAAHGLATSGLQPLLGETPQSVILYEASGRRQIHVDLKEIQETEYPAEIFDRELQACRLAALCNINFSRPFLKKARSLGKTVATDVHVLGDVRDPYNRDFIEAADILFLSDENVKDNAREFLREIAATSPAQIIVMGRGPLGSLLFVRRDNFFGAFPAISTRPIVNTIGAGDALFSAFLHGTLNGLDPYQALWRAQIFASWKIGTKSAAEGFLTLSDWDAQCKKIASAVVAPSLN